MQLVVTSWISHRTNKNTRCGIVRSMATCGWKNFPGEESYADFKSAVSQTS